MLGSSGYRASVAAVPPPPTEPLTGRRFPPPWRVVEVAGCFIVQDATGQNVAWFHFENDATVAPSAAVPLKEQVRRRAVNFAGPLLGKADSGA
jgi:hypothetical protein